MLNQELFNFIEESPSVFHVVENIVKRLENDGFKELKEISYFNINKNGKYYVKRNDSSIIAFKIPDNPLAFNIVASHSDSPTFKVKPESNLINEQYLRLSVEAYGGMLCSSWFDRPLSVAGRVFYQNENGICNKNIKIDKDLLIIPNVAIHLNREANEGIKYNLNIDLPPLMGEGKGQKKALEELLANQLHIKQEQLLSYDLFLYNRQKGLVWGLNDEFISSPKLDDLQCAFASLKAFIASNNQNNINLFCCFDNEEIGSKTRQGADSTFLFDTIMRICKSLSLNMEIMMAKSFLISADNAHAVHPNHPELSDSLNRVYMNKGVVIKFNAAQSYTTDGLSMAIFKTLCNQAKVNYQSYTNRSDLKGGGTLGNIAISHLNLNSIDIGCPQLAMHSSFETSGANDTEQMKQVLEAFYNSSIEFDSNKLIIT